MPTGYTAALCDGEQSFEEFVLSCARAFGALIVMRDEPHDAPIPDEFEPHTEWHDKRLAEAEQRVVRLRNMSLDEAAEELRQEYLNVQRQRRDSNMKAAAIRDRLEAMLAKVEAWKPPTPDHDGLRKFMREQLEETIRWDGSPSQWPPYPPEGDPQDWKLRAIEKAERDVAYHRDERQKEIERTNQRNAWVRALRESLQASALTNTSDGDE